MNSSEIRLSRLHTFVFAAVVLIICAKTSIGQTNGEPSSITPETQNVLNQIIAGTNNDLNRQIFEGAKIGAAKGDPESQWVLGDAYHRGLGVPKNNAEAAKWFRKSAEQGFGFGKQSLGLCYFRGEGVPKNYVEAYKWFSLASLDDFLSGSPMVSEVEKLMTAEDISEAQRLASAFKPRKALEDGDAVSKESIIDSQPQCSGTGFFITEDGFLVTNHHVVEEAKQVRILSGAGIVSARVMKVDVANDLALLKVEGKFSPLPVVASKTAHLGDSVITVGFPNVGLQGFSPKFAKGEIAALSGAADDARYFQISVPLQPGNSGGALVDEHGNVVGVVAAKLSALAAFNSSGALPENVNYAIKSSFLLSFLESVPEVSARLKEPETKDRKAEDVVKSAEQAAVLVLVY